MNTVVIEVDMVTYFGDLVRILVLDLVPFCSHAYAMVVAVLFDNYLVPPFRSVLVL